MQLADLCGAAEGGEQFVERSLVRFRATELSKRVETFKKLTPQHRHTFALLQVLFGGTTRVLTVLLSASNTQAHDATVSHPAEPSPR